MTDYFEPIEAEILQAQSQDPDAVFPWSWWKKKAGSVGMSPNALYTRAVKSGLYVPPPKRGEDRGNDDSHAATFHGNGGFSAKAESPLRSANGASSHSPSREGQEKPPIMPLTPPAPDETRFQSSHEDRPVQDRPLAHERMDARRWKSSRSVETSAHGIQDSIQGLAAMFASTLEKQIDDLSRELEETREENRRLRGALRQMESLSSQMGAVYRNFLSPDTAE